MAKLAFMAQCPECAIKLYFYGFLVRLFIEKSMILALVDKLLN